MSLAQLSHFTFQNCLSSVSLSTPSTSRLPPIFQNRSFQRPTTMRESNVSFGMQLPAYLPSSSSPQSVEYPTSPSLVQANPESQILPETSVISDYYDQLLSPSAPPLISHASSSRQESSCDRVGKKWTNELTHVLIGLRQDTHSTLKSASNKKKTELYDEMLKKLNDIPNNFNTTQMKTKLRYLEKKYKEIKLELPKTGQDGVGEITEEFLFFEDLDNFLGLRDANNPEMMTIESSSNPLNASNQAKSKKRKRRKDEENEENNSFLALAREQMEEDRIFKADMLNEFKESTSKILEANKEQTMDLIGALRDIFKDRIKNRI